MIAGFLTGTAGAILVGVLTGLLTREAEGRLDALPRFLLRLARRRLPEDSRNDLYDEWSAELHAALHATEGRPLARLILGTRFAAGLLRSARRIASGLGPARRTSPPDERVPANALLPGSALMAPGGPTALRIILGAQLRRLREQRRIGRAEAAAFLGTPAELSRIELGQAGLTSGDVAALLTFYGITDPGEREALLRLADRSGDSGWWLRKGDVLPPWFDVQAVLEEAASMIRLIETQQVPALLQTEDYARAAIGLSHPGEVEERVAHRMRHRSLLTASAPPRLWAVVTEAALRRPVGDAAVMRGQLRHLIELSALPNVSIQVRPFHLGNGIPAGGPFGIFRFADRRLPDLVYSEQLTSALYLDKREDVDYYTAVLGRLTVDALLPEASIELLDAMLREVW
jgi:transcriptional regulator with XRE-family HTH domain